MELQQRHPMPEERRQQGIPRLTPEELKVMRECSAEGFYKRSLPFSALFAAATYGLCDKGILKKHPKYGAMGKVTFAAFMGYIVGKVSYMSVCQVRLLNVPDGVYAAQMRGRQASRETLESGFMPQATFDRSPSTSQLLDEPPSSSLNVDLESVQVSEPEFTRPYAEDFTFNEAKFNEPLLYSPPVTTYDELRKQNRDQFEASRNLASQSASRPYRPPSSSVLLEPEERVARRKKNQYGDDMEV